MYRAYQFTSNRQETWLKEFLSVADGYDSTPLAIRTGVGPDLREKMQERFPEAQMELVPHLKTEFWLKVKE